MKLDLKSILILVLLVFSIVFFSMWYFKKDNSKDELNILKEDNRKIELVRDSLKQESIILKEKFILYQKDINSRALEISRIETLLDKSKLDNQSLNKSLSDMKSELSKTQKQIGDLVKNPKTLDSLDLMNSLKQKYKK